MQHHATGLEQPCFTGTSDPEQDIPGLFSHWTLGLLFAGNCEKSNRHGEASKICPMTHVQTIYISYISSWGPNQPQVIRFKWFSTSMRSKKQENIHRINGKTARTFPPFSTQTTQSDWRFNLFWCLPGIRSLATEHLFRLHWFRLRIFADQPGPGRCPIPGFPGNLARCHGCKIQQLWTSSYRICLGISWVIECPHWTSPNHWVYGLFYGYYNVMSNSPKNGHLPIPEFVWEFAWGFSTFHSWRVYL